MRFSVEPAKGVDLDFRCPRVRTLEVQKDYGDWNGNEYNGKVDCGLSPRTEIGDPITLGTWTSISVNHG
jgi:hypothetical protein